MLTVEVWSLSVASTSGPACSFCASSMGARLHTLTRASAPPVAKRRPLCCTCTVYTPPAEGEGEGSGQAQLTPCREAGCAAGEAERVGERRRRRRATRRQLRPGEAGGCSTVITPREQVGPTGCPAVHSPSHHRAARWAACPAASLVMAAAYRGAEGLLRPPATAPQRPSPRSQPRLSQRRCSPCTAAIWGNTDREGQPDRGMGAQASSCRSVGSAPTVRLRGSSPTIRRTCLHVILHRGHYVALRGGGEEQSKEGMHMEREEATVHRYTRRRQGGGPMRACRVRQSRRAAALRRQRPRQPPHAAWRTSASSKGQTCAPRCPAEVQAGEGG